MQQLTRKVASLALNDVSVVVHVPDAEARKILEMFGVHPPRIWAAAHGRETTLGTVAKEMLRSCVPVGDVVESLPSWRYFCFRRGDCTIVLPHTTRLAALVTGTRLHLVLTFHKPPTRRLTRMSCQFATR